MIYAESQLILKMKIAICDDEHGVRTRLRSFVEKYTAEFSDLSIDEYASGEKLICSFEKGNGADIIFLDIEMNKIDGIDVAKLIRIKDQKAIIIFVSSHGERVFDSFDTEPFHFITKPFTEERFKEIFEKALNKYKLLNGFLVISRRNEKIKLPVSRIKFFEMCRKHLIFHTYDGEYETVGTVRETMDKLRPYGFIQTHQGYAVNMNLIKRFDGTDIILEDGTKVVMSLRKRSEVLTEYAKHIARCR